LSFYYKYMSHAYSLDRLRYARYGGFRRDGNSSYKAHFGYGGADFGGFGRYGKYGGWRSTYPYGECHDKPFDQGGECGGVCETRQLYPIPNDPPVNMIVERTSHHSPTFWFAIFFLFFILAGLWFGRSNNTSRMFGGGRGWGSYGY
jgi:hypothetical protein